MLLLERVPMISETEGESVAGTLEIKFRVPVKLRLPVVKGGEVPRL